MIQRHALFLHQRRYPGTLPFSPLPRLHYPPLDLAILTEFNSREIGTFKKELMVSRENLEMTKWKKERDELQREQAELNCILLAEQRSNIDEMGVQQPGHSLPLLPPGMV